MDRGGLLRTVGRSPPQSMLLSISSFKRATHIQNLPIRSPRFQFLKNPNFRSLKTLIAFPSSTNQEENSVLVQHSSGFSGYSTSGRVSMASNGGDNQTVQFQLSPSSLLKIQKGDITRWFVDGSSDAIVNAANERMLGGGGVDGAIHRAAGPELKGACYDVPEVSPGVRCPTGEARITPAFKLPVAHVIHTVGPVYNAVDQPEVYLRNAYSNCLRLAKENNVQYIAFPAISCGVYGYPFDKAATIAISTVKEFAADLKEVHFVLFSDDIYTVWVEKAHGLL